VTRLPPTHQSPLSQDFAGGLLLWALVVIAYFLYLPALHAPWQFDDAPNLHGLSAVHDAATALSFITSGISSGLGRPLALASFLLNAADWPSDPAAFRHLNVLLHLLNGLLVAWLALRVLRLQTQTSASASPIWPALALAAIWLLHPFLASSSLLVVQRMTLLAATFTLLGLLGFVHGRGLLHSRPRAAYAWMSGGLVLGAGLGVLVKENAALLPFFAWALSATVLAHRPCGNRRLWLRWQLVFFAGPALLLTAYVVTHWSTIVHGYASRPFTLGERLLTEPMVLWDYVRQLLVPNVALMGPFHDGVAPQHGLDLISALAILCWTGALTAAVALRRRAPWLALAVLWFLAGHLLESTVFNLELYFEHRNYLPSLGPLAGLVALAWSGRSIWPRIAISGAAILAGLLLFQVTSLWGSPRLAAERWATAHPASSRATQFLAQRHVLAGDDFTAMRIIRRASKAQPQASDLAVQAIQLSCGQVQASELQTMLNDLVARIGELQPSLATLKATETMRVEVLEKHCPGLDEEGLIRLDSALLENPKFKSSGLYRHHLHHQLARIYTTLGNLDGAVRNLQAAFEARPNPQTAKLLAATLASAGLYTEAIASLEHAMSRAPSSTLKRDEWKATLKPIKDILSQYQTQKLGDRSKL
jgi:tetratricopeptide (TPR) repeat protein